MANAQDLMDLFNVTGPQLQRAGNALGKYLNLRDENGDIRNPTPDEFVWWLKRHVRGVVLRIERAEAEAQININTSEWEG